MNKYYHSLELHKILGLLSEYCSNEFTRKKALELEPSNDIDFVKNDTGEQIKGYIFGDLSKSTPYTRIEDFYYSLMALMDLIEKTGDKEYRMHIWDNIPL